MKAENSRNDPRRTGEDSLSKSTSGMALSQVDEINLIKMLSGTEPGEMKRTVNTHIKHSVNYRDLSKSL